MGRHPLAVPGFCWAGKMEFGCCWEQKDNVVKFSACWVWRPIGKVIDHVSKNSRSYICKQFDYVDLAGRLKYMSGNKSYLTDYQDYDGGFVAFASSSKGVFLRYVRKNSVLFTKTECLILSPKFKLPDESQVMLKVPKKNNMYSFNLKNVVSSKGLTCLFAKATNDEYKLWHRRLGYINFKTMNKLVKANLVRGLPSKIFENDHTCIACQKGKQHKATWIKREFSNARTQQQNGVAERKNRTLIEAARTMLADSLLPIPFWVEAVNTVCYVHERVLVTKPHNKTPYELLIGRIPIISFMRPFGCPVTILNTLDHLGKFDGKADKGFLVGYSINSKAFRVFNNRTRKVEENLHVNFLENKPNVAGNGPEWLFDIDSLTNSMNYQRVSAGNRTNGYAGSETNSDVGQAKKEKVPDQEYILLPLLHTRGKIDDLESLDQQVKIADDAENINSTNNINTASPTVNVAGDKDGNFHSTNDELVFSTTITVNATSLSFGHPDALEDHSKMTNLKDTGIFDDAYDDRDEGADYNNLESIISVSPILSTRANKGHSKDQIIGEIEPKKVTQALEDEGWVEAMQEELLLFKLLNVWTLVDLPYGKKAIGTKWVFKNKKDQRGIVVRNKARLVA
ncbi:ribonuclease H-like domain-containing protein [Tanacetum coccineum]